MSGTFIVLEGPDGSGTTLHARLLTERMKKAGKAVLNTAEPTEGEYGKRAYQAIRSNEPFSPEEIQKLFCLDRADHVERTVQPALDNGKIVICDRYIPSTIIYGEAAGVPGDFLEQLNESFPGPDLLIIALPPFEVCWERVCRRDSHDAFEKEEFQKIVYAGYQRYAANHPEAVVIDTSGKKAESGERIWQLAESLTQ